MNRIKTIMLLLALGGYAVAGQAQQDEQVTRSAEKFQVDQTVEMSQLLAKSELISKSAPTQSEDYASKGSDSEFAGIANRHDQLFSIYEANVRLAADFDEDGYFHEITVSFDVDVNVESASVYAKLYLSRNGGPWGQYFTTRVFHIDGNASSDAYEVTTELVEGYPPGYYDVLVEIYSLDHAYMVTSKVLDFHYLGKDVALEDRGWDEPYYYDDYGYTDVSVAFGAGSFSLLLIFFLVLQVAIAARGSLRLTPYKPKTIINRNP